jgi:hypothetical protein
VETSCEHGNELLSSIKCWKILERLRDWWPLKKDLAPWIKLVSLKIGTFIKILKMQETKHSTSNIFRIIINSILFITFPEYPMPTSQEQVPPQIFGNNCLKEARVGFNPGDFM